MNRIKNVKVFALSGLVFGLILAAAVIAPQGYVSAEGLDLGGGLEFGEPYEIGGGGGLEFGQPSELSSGCTWDCYYNGDTGCWDCYSGDEYLGSYCDECYNTDSYSYDEYCDCYSSGGSYSTGGGSYGGGSFGGYSMPKSTGGGYIVTPRTYSPPQSSGGSQSQTQTQSTNVSNTNTNTNTNINNNTAIAVVQVQAPSAPSYPSYPNYPTYQAPYCSIYQAQSYGGYGYNRPVYLSWSSSNAESAYLSNYGSVAVNGSQTVYPTYATTYTLTVYGYNGQQATCQTTVNVGSYVPPTPIPTTPYVSLTQIPYTGVDFGTFGNAMYFAAIAILALGGAYLAVFYVPQLAFARGINKRSFAPVVAPKAPLLLEKEAEVAKVTPIVASIRKGTNDTMAIIQAKGSLPKIVIDRS